MKSSFLLSVLAIIAAATSTTNSLVQGFAPMTTRLSTQSSSSSSSSSLQAKYKTMDEILALFPEEKPVLINFYDADTEAQIKNDIVQTKALLKDRATLVSIKQQDYPELAKLWDANERSPSMILFKDGSPVKRIYGKTDYMDIIADISKYTQED
eukprot:scaffold22588_cov114-Cylindrotheca_fusiformis.AAC.2